MSDLERISSELNEPVNEEEEVKTDNPNPSPVDNENKIPAWLACKFRLDKFCNKEQTFTITGWINVFWKMDKLINMPYQTESTPHSNYLPKIEKLQSLENIEIQQTRDAEMYNIGNAKIYSNNLKQKIIKIVDLQQTAIAYYLPIDANKIFHETSLQYIHHIEPPSLYYNRKSNLGHIQYHITATLFENLELYDFPFDRQFLNIKLKWNALYFTLLNWKKKIDEQTGREIFTQKQIDKDKPDKPDKPDSNSKEKKTINSLSSLYYENPLSVDVSDSLRSEIDILDPWIDFDVDNSSITQHDRYALIRLRIKRNPTNFCLTVLVPFFIIVSCSFTIFAIDSDSIADRLGVSVTILLTFTAFQNMVDQELPKTRSTEYIDKYILLAYGIQGLIIIGACLLPTIVHSDVDDEIYLIIELVFICFIAIIWIGSSIFYVMKARNVLKDQKNDRLFWEQRATQNAECKKKGTERTKYEYFSAYSDDEPHNDDDNMRKGGKSNDLEEALISNDRKGYGSTSINNINS